VAVSHRLKTLSRNVDGVIRVLFAARIPAQASIHSTAHFSHSVLAVVVTRNAEIGVRCQIGLQVLLGSRWPVDGARYCKRMWSFTRVRRSSAGCAT
jgi:serine acetyltransferase